MLRETVKSGSEGAAITALQTAGPDEINAIDAEGQSLLFVGARRGLTTFCQKLLEHHFLNEPATRTSFGESAIHIAAKHGWVSTVSALVKHPRMQKLARSKNGRTPLHCAAEEGHSLVVKALLDCTNFEDMNAQDNLGHTALHLAASQGHVAVCSILLASPRFKAVNAKDWKGWTALHCAAEQGQDEACSALLGSGRCQVLAVQQDCLSALQLASSRGHESTCQLLQLHPAFSPFAEGMKTRQATTFVKSTEEHFESFDAIVAKLKAIPEVALHVPEEAPEAESISSILWRLSGIEAQLDAEKQPQVQVEKSTRTSRSPSPTHRQVAAEALPPFALRKEQRQLLESELTYEQIQEVLRIPEETVQSASSRKLGDDRQAPKPLKEIQEMQQASLWHRENTAPFTDVSFQAAAANFAPKQEAAMAVAEKTEKEKREEPNLKTEHLQTEPSQPLPASQADGKDTSAGKVAELGEKQAPQQGVDGTAQSGEAPLPAARQEAAVAVVEAIEKEKREEPNLKTEHLQTEPSQPLPASQADGKDTSAGKVAELGEKQAPQQGVDGTAQSGEAPLPAARQEAAAAVAEAIEKEKREEPNLKTEHLQTEPSQPLSASQADGKDTSAGKVAELGEKQAPQQGVDGTAQSGEAPLPAPRENPPANLLKEEASLAGAEGSEKELGSAVVVTSAVQNFRQARRLRKGQNRAAGTGPPQTGAQA